MMSQNEAAAILGVEVDASRAAVQRAFRDIARQVHPDAGNGDNSAEALRLQQAKEARDALLGTRGERTRRIVNGPRPWPPREDSWPPRSGAGAGSGRDDDTKANRFVSSDASDSETASSDADSKDFAQRLSEASDRGSNWIVALTLVAILVVFLVVGAILIVGALFGSSPDATPTPSATGCVAITDSGLTEVACDQPDAQRIVSKTEAIVDCPPGQNMLNVGQTTWCLEFVNS